MKKPTILVILDGWGMAPPSKSNAITLAKTPVLDQIYSTYPSTILGATGVDVGLEPNKMSGSESGHINIGAGRIVPQDSLEITESIKDESFFSNPVLLGACEHAKRTGGNFHVMGLMGNSDSPHSDPEHFRSTLRLAKENGISQVYCHLFTDGRDSYPQSAGKYLANFQKIMKEEKIGKVATLSGRFYAMDRTKRWERNIRVYDALVFSQAETAKTPEKAIEENYKRGLSDEYLFPTVILENGKPMAKIAKNDSVVFYNFRSDRARQLTKFFMANNKSSVLKDNMPVVDRIKNLYFVAMTDFGPDLDVHTAFTAAPLKSTLPMALRNLKQLYTSEVEKFAHVTYFLNGGYADAVGGEERIMVESPLVKSYAEAPEMSAEIITENVLQYVKKNIYDFITINFANADMVGHTGNLEATVKAVEVLDEQIGKIYKEVNPRDGNLIVTADHGNADDMIDFDTNQPNTFHTKNPVPFILISDRFKKKKMREDGVLGNIAPTILEILEINRPKAMKEKSLL